MGSPYTQVGTWNDSAPPAISPAFLDALEAFLLSLSSIAYDTNFTSDQSGNLNIPNTGHYNIGGINVMYSPSTQNLFINVPNVGGGHKGFLQVGGVNQLSWDSAGNVRIAGTLTQSTTP